MSTWLFAVDFCCCARLGPDGRAVLRLSNFAMTAFGKLPTPAGIAAMQAINIYILNPLFFAVFFGTGALSAVLVLIALFSLGQAWSLPLLAAGLSHVVGSPLVTMIFNVPLNNRLAAARPESAEAKVIWTEYLRVWTLWNHVRTVLCLAATALFIIALCGG